MILSSWNKFVVEDISSAAGRKQCFILPFVFLFFFYKILFQSTPLDFSNQYLAPGGKGTFGSWGKGSSGGTSTSTKPVESGNFQSCFCFFFFSF